MVDRMILVALYRSEEDAVSKRKRSTEKIFEAYGKLDRIIYPYRSDHYFIVVFENKASLVECLRNEETILRKHVFITRFVQVEDMNEHGLVEDGGPVDSHTPSLMNLNDDCISHILKFLPEIMMMENVSLRVRRLWKQRFAEDGDWSYKDRIDHIFYHGPLIQCIKLADLSRGQENFDLFYFLSLRCTNLKYVEADVGNYEDDSAARCLLELLKPATDLSLYIDNFEDLLYFIQDSRNLRRLKICNPLLSFKPIAAQNPFQFLTNLLTPRTKIEVGLTLTELPGLQVLVCKVAESKAKFPSSHGLREFGGHFRKCALEFLKVIGAVCQQLRYLRIEGNVPSLQGVSARIPHLKGVHLQDVLVSKEDLVSFMTSRMRILFVGRVNGVTKEEFPAFMAHFKQIQILYWNERKHGDVGVMLQKRGNFPLKIVVYDDSREMEMFKKSFPMVKCEYVHKVFGKFSAFSITTFTTYRNFRVLL